MTTKEHAFFANICFSNDRILSQNAKPKEYDEKTTNSKFSKWNIPASALLRDFSDTSCIGESINNGKNSNHLRKPINSKHKIPINI